MTDVKASLKREKEARRNLESQVCSMKRSACS